jgi:hypothetical protein
MSTLFRTRTGGPQAVGDARIVFDRWEPSGSPYLSDGVELYRYVGGVPHGSSELVALEDCRSLKLLLFTLEDLRGLGLRSVNRVAGEPEARPSR